MRVKGSAQPVEQVLERSDGANRWQQAGGLVLIAADMGTSPYLWPAFTMKELPWNKLVTMKRDCHQQNDAFYEPSDQILQPDGSFERLQIESWDVEYPVRAVWETLVISFPLIWKKLVEYRNYGSLTVCMLCIVMPLIGGMGYWGEWDTFSVFSDHVQEFRPDSQDGAREWYISKLADHLQHDQRIPFLALCQTWIKFVSGIPHDFISMLNQSSQ